MNSPSFSPGTKPTAWRVDLLTWLPIIAGLAVLYVPSLVDLFSGVWASDEQMHGPIVLGIACWLIYRNWGTMLQASEGEPTSAWGWPFAIFALLLYTLGRSQDILLFEIGSVIWLLLGIGLLARGAKAVKAQWFALFFMLFMVPLPGAVILVPGLAAAAVWVVAVGVAWRAMPRGMRKLRM